MKNVMVLHTSEIIHTGFQVMINSSHALKSDNEFRSVSSIHPDIIIVGGSYTRHVSFILDIFPEATIIITEDNFDNMDVDNMLEALEIGVIGYIPESISTSALIFALSDVHERRTNCAALDTIRGKLKEDALAPFCRLTTREIETLAIFSRCYNYESTAHIMGITPESIRNYLSNIYMKIPGVTNAAGAVSYATKNNVDKAMSLQNVT